MKKAFLALALAVVALSVSAQNNKNRRNIADLTEQDYISFFEDEEIIDIKQFIQHLKQVNV